MPVIDRRVVLNARVAADPRSLRHLAEDFACLERLYRLAANNGACLPRAIVLDCLHELVGDAHRVVPVLEEDRAVGFAGEAGVVAGLNQCPGLLLFTDLRIDELLDVRMLHVEDHHLCGAARLATGLHNTSEGVKALHERDRARGGATTAHLLFCAADRGEVGTCTRTELEEHRLGLREVHDR